jgi:hypothetical protein
MTGLGPECVSSRVALLLRLAEHIWVLSICIFYYIILLIWEQLGLTSFRGPRLVAGDFGGFTARASLVLSVLPVQRVLARVDWDRTPCRPVWPLRTLCVWWLPIFLRLFFGGARARKSLQAAKDLSCSPRPPGSWSFAAMGWVGRE